MKFCFINTAVFGVDGIGRVMSVLANELVKRHDVTFVTFENPNSVNKKRYNLSEKVHVEYWPPLWKKCYFRRAIHKFNQKNPLLKQMNCLTIYDWIYFPKFMQNYWIDFINENGFDVVIAAQSKLAVILGKISDRINCKTIGWQHNSYEAYLENPGYYNWNQDLIIEKYIPNLTHYVVLNEHDEKAYREKKGIKAVTIHNPKSFVSEKKSACTDKRFICVGGLRPQKGFDYAIEAYSLFCKKNPDWKLDLFGDGEERVKLEKKIGDMNLNGLATLKGTTNDIQKELLHSGVFLLPSRWEGMPMVVLEAMEIGLPTISFDINAINPLVTDGVEGIIVKQFDVTAFAQAMERLAADEELRKQYGKNAATKAKQFAVEEIAKKWEALFQD